MTDILIPLVVSAITALTFVAYRHPAQYPRLARLVTWALIAVILLMSAYAMGVRVGMAMIIESLKLGREKVNEQANIFNGQATTVLFTLLTVALYADALTRLPKLLKLGSYKGEDKETGD